MGVGDAKLQKLSLEYSELKTALPLVTTQVGPRTSGICFSNIPGMLLLGGTVNLTVVPLLQMLRLGEKSRADK
jgi:hypothetical protein